MKFDWDPNKAETNEKKHGVTFDEATLVFTDIFALEEYDEAHSTMEQKRYQRIGEGFADHILFVVYRVVDEGTPNETYRIRFGAGSRTG